jgi:phage terminase large subunit-like protein
MKDSRATEAWIRNRSDELAVDDGCWFNAEQGAFVVWWIERYCYLYEGENAGEHVQLRSGCEHLLPFETPVLEHWDSGGREKSLTRAAIYEKWIADGNSPDWQYECTMRMFGWMKYSEHFKRTVRRFRQAVIFISKKNKKTPTLASWGVYLICGDSEYGAKSFAVAKNGGQACIAMEHAIRMVQQSPELSSECKINQNQKSITHIPTHSIYKPLATNNSATQAANEGRNGNMLIDEIHVVDRSSVATLKGAGISRAEFFRIEVSTAGNNPDGYGKERQDEARQVLCGAEKNNDMFVAIYEAPQSLKDSELESDPIKYGKMANPAWGHTINPEEYLADYNQSKRTISGLADFKMYRLNIWQHTSNQWLRLDQWIECGADYKIEDYRGSMASIGIDLSKTKDMSALAISIPVGDKVQLFNRLWMTESYIEANSDKANFKEWVASGALQMIPGETIQESFIREEFDKLCKLLQVKILVKDRAFAADFTEWVEENHSRVLQVDYPQNAQMMEKPIDDFEAAVIEGSLIHDLNPCMNWQAGHASVHMNARGFRIIKKPYRADDYRKVDGMVASVMSHWGTKQLPKKSSVYRRRGVLTA